MSQRVTKRDKRTMRQVARDVVVKKKQEFDRKMKIKNNTIFYLCMVVFALAAALLREAIR